MIESGIPPNYGLHAGMDPAMYRGDAAMHDAAMREAAAVAQQEEMWDDAQIAHNLDEQARLTAQAIAARERVDIIFASPYSVLNITSFHACFATSCHVTPWCCTNAASAGPLS